jgi:dihydrolipoamide dehydrogenase
MTQAVDVAIIGAGTAGLAALREVRKQTENFVIINDGPYGTTCARVGCMPSKALIEAARAFHRRHALAEFGVTGIEQLSVDIPAVLRRVRRLRDDFVSGTLERTEDLGDRNIAGRARLESEDTLVVNNRQIHARRIILASGSRPVVPDAWRALGDHVLTSDTIFEQADFPARVAVIGLGPVGVELGQAMARLGVSVAAFSQDESIAGITDPQIRGVALGCLQREFDIHLGTAAEVELVGEELQVTAGKTVVYADQVLVAMGRRPNLDGIGLERLGVALDEQGLPPFDPQTLQVGDLPVFIAGDVNDRLPVLHEAADDGYIAGRNAIAASLECYERRTPLSIVFTDPDVAVVGRSFASLREGDALIGEASFERQGRARTAEKNRGALRIYADKHSGRLLGSELCVPEGEHMAHLLALAVQQQISIHGLLRLPFYHPVLEEGLRTALRQLASQFSDGSAPDLAACDSFGAEALD